MARRATSKKRRLDGGKRFLREISSGGVVFRVRDGTTEVALIRVRDRWCLPKGQVESGESVEATAVREVGEETGLKGDVVGKLGDITYWYTAKARGGEPERIFKRVYFYLLRHAGGDVSAHDAEVDEAAWFPLQEARQRLAYASEKAILDKARAWLEKSGSA
ncbi:MAG TPA: NUDIX hydrolase [Candidatus Acidoferrales bacterium]|nr:NUDIX hydrolase [Candidatus Acidoferrales bacterium]